MPATLSTQSTRPNSATAASNIAATSSSLVTSQCTGSTPAPTSAAVCSCAPLMSPATTFAPSATNSFVDALAMPEPAPVITATLPSSSPISFLPGIDAGRVSQPRTVDVGASRASDRSTSQSGNRFSSSSSATRPSSRASGGAEAEVDAVPEREVLADLAMDVEPVGVVELALVAVGGADEEQDRAALRDGLPVDLDVARDVAPDVGRRRLEAQQLLDRVGDAGTGRRRARAAGRGGRTSTLPAQPMSRVVVSLPAPAMTARYVSSSWRSRRRVTPCSSSNSAVQQLGHEVVGGVLGAPVEVVPEVLERRGGIEAVAVVLGLAGLGADVRVGAVTHGFLVLLGDAEQHPDHPHRHLRRRSRRRSRTGRCRPAGRASRRSTPGSGPRARASSSA